MLPRAQLDRSKPSAPTHEASDGNQMACGTAATPDFRRAVYLLSKMLYCAADVSSRSRNSTYNENIKWKIK